jgi:hypothetical protein
MWNPSLRLEGKGADGEAPTEGERGREMEEGVGLCR